MRWKAASSSSGDKLATRQTRQPAFTAIPACHTLPPKSIAVPASHTGRNTVDGVCSPRAPCTISCSGGQKPVPPPTKPPPAKLLPAVPEAPPGEVSGDNCESLR